MGDTISLAKVKTLVNSLDTFSSDDIQHINEGIATEVFKLHRNNHALYLRIAPQGENMTSQALVHDLVKQQGVIAPDIIVVEDFNPIIQRSYMIASEISGQAISKTTNRSPEPIIEAGKQLALVHRVLVKHFGWLDMESENVQALVAEDKTYADFIFDMPQIQEKLHFLSDNQVIEHSFASKLFDYVQSRKSGLHLEQAVLAHGDFSNDHIYAHNGQYSGIIDFGDIRATSRYHDLARYLLSEPDAFPHLLKGYKQVATLDRNYEDWIEMEALLLVIRIVYWLSKNKPDMNNNIVELVAYAKKTLT